MKKPIAMLLSFVLLLSFLPLVSAAVETQTPVIHIFGFMSSPIYADPADEGSDRLFPPEKNAILDMVKRLLPAVSSFTVTKNWARFGDRLIPALNDLLLPVGNDERGDPKGSTGARFVRPAKEEIAETGRADSVCFCRGARRVCRLCGGRLRLRQGRAGMPQLRRRGHADLPCRLWHREGEKLLL